MFLVSPHKVILNVLTQGSGFPYADTFNIEARFTLTASKARPGGRAEAKTHLKIEHRMNFLKSVKLFASTMLRESEK